MSKTLFTAMAVITLMICNLSFAEEEDIDLEKIVVTPTRITQYGYKTASNVTVIDSRRIQASGAQNIADILKEELGIHVYDNSTDKTATVDIRGFGDTAGRNVLVLIDGRKINPVDISGPDWVQIPIETIERIEILRGAGSVLYGDNAVGGVINIITKKGKGAMSVKTGIIYGNYNAHQEDLTISGAHNNLSYHLYSKYSETDGYRSNSDLLTKDFNTRVGYDFSDRLSFDFAAGWHEDDYGMPGGLNDVSELVQYGRRGSPDEENYASTKDRYVKLSFDARPKLEGRELGRFILDISRRNRDAYSLFDYSVWSSGILTTKYMIDTDGVTLKYVYDEDISDKEFNFVTGIDYYDAKNKIKGGGSGAMANSDDLTITKKELGFYAYSEYELFNSIFINGGARYQKANYRFDQKAANLVYETKHPSESLFMGGVKYEYADGSSIYFSVQETFRFLATDEWYSTSTGLNTNLKQQTGRQYEMGIKHGFGDRLTLSATPYWIDIEDEIYFNPYPGFGKNGNYDKTRRRGLELELKTDLFKLTKISFLEKLDFFANYAYQQPKFKGGDYNGNDIPMAPRYQSGAGLTAKFLKSYSFSLTGNYIGARYVINDTRNETSKLKPYFTLNGKIAYNKNSLEIFLRANNIFNEKYSSYAVKSTSSTLKDYYPSPERNFEIGISRKF